MADSFPELRPAARILLGPGPSNVNPRVMKAMASPVVGHLDPDFLKVMENIKRLLRIVFRTAERDHVSRLRHRLCGNGNR